VQGRSQTFLFGGATGGASFATKGAVNGLCRTFRKRPEKFLGGHWGVQAKFWGAVAPLAPPSSAPGNVHCFWVVDLSCLVRDRAILLALIFKTWGNDGAWRLSLGFEARLCESRSPTFSSESQLFWQTFGLEALTESRCERLRLRSRLHHCWEALMFWALNRLLLKLQ